MIWA